MACLFRRGDVDNEVEKNAKGRLQGKLLDCEIAQGGEQKMDRRDEMDNAAGELAWLEAALRQAEDEDKADKVLPF